MSRVANFDKVVVGELRATLLGQKSLVAKFKFVNTKTGRSYGSTTSATWSDAVWAKFNELKELMENEVDAVMFEEGESPQTMENGLGELFEEDAPSI